MPKRIEISDPVRGYVIYAIGGWLGVQLADGSHENFSTAAYVGDGLWHHVAITVDRDSSTGFSVYLDKRLVTVANPTSRRGSFTNPQPFTLGRRSDHPWWPGFMSGGLDEIKLFNRALTDAEIQNL